MDSVYKEGNASNPIDFETMQLDEVYSPVNEKKTFENLEAYRQNMGWFKKASKITYLCNYYGHYWVQFLKRPVKLSNTIETTD